jgi:hypothetical protein
MKQFLLPFLPTQFGVGPQRILTTQLPRSHETESKGIHRPRLRIGRRCSATLMPFASKGPQKADPSALWGVMETSERQQF